MMQSSAAYSGMYPVETLHNGWLVLVGVDIAARGLRSNAEAWDWIDRNTDEGRADYERYCRIRDAFSK